MLKLWADYGNLK
jgi:hypothetical protein